MTHRRQHQSHLTLSSLVQLQLDPAAAPAHRSRRQTGSSRRGLSSFNLDAGAELLQRPRRRSTRDLGEIRLDDAVTRVRQGVREGAIVRQQQQPLAFAVQPADRMQPLDGGMAATIGGFQTGNDQLHHRMLGMRIGAGGVETGRLVERQVEGRGPSRDRAAVDEDRRMVGINFRPKRGDGLAVDLDPSGQDHSFGVASGCDAGGGENLL